MVNGQKQDTIIVWTTSHRINQLVLEAVVEGLHKEGVSCSLRKTRDYNGRPVPSLSYGVLRGAGQIYQDCEKSEIPWWNIDKGFFKPGHYDGFYRIGYRHLQPLFLAERQEDNSRWKQLNIPILPWVHRPEGVVLICPPEGICEFYGIDQKGWLKRVVRSLPESLQDKVAMRFRDTNVPLVVDFSRSRCVVTHSSNVALEALLAGIPAIAETGIVRSWNHKSIGQAEESQEELDRTALFEQAANAQFTLDEFRSGYAWKSTALRMMPCFKPFSDVG